MKLKPELNAMYGDKGVVGNYLVGEVLTLLGLDMNEGPVSYTHLTLPTSDLV